MGASGRRHTAADAAMWALAKSGVRIHTLINDDGTIECWQAKLPAWEVPKRNPHERRPRAREPDELTAERDAAAGADIAA